MGRGGKKGQAKEKLYSDGDSRVNGGNLVERWAIQQGVNATDLLTAT